MRQIIHDYQPRKIFDRFHARKQRWAIEVVHRRGGKTVATINDTIARMLNFKPPKGHRAPGRFGYIAPFYAQAKAVAWDYVKSYSRGMTKKVSEGELSITMFNDAKFTLYGADNPDAFRGLYFDGVDLDEYGMMKPSTWSEVILPTLIDRKGWATFIGTPNGPNHFRDLVLAARRDPEKWFYESHPVSETKLIPEDELDELRKLMLEEEYEQEMECSFEASTRGAFYVRELKAMREEGRIAQMNPDPDMPLDFIFDLGYRDDTALLGTQKALDGFPVIHAEAASLRPISYYVTRMDEICDLHGTTRGHVWLPWDAKAKSLQTGRSIVEQFYQEFGIRPQIVPRLDFLDGIAAVRMIFPTLYLNDQYTQELQTALASYRRKYDPDKKVFEPKAVHDWSSHYADVLRYYAIIARKGMSPKKEKEAALAKVSKAEGAHHAFTLQNLFDDREQRKWH